MPIPTQACYPHKTPITLMTKTMKIKADHQKAKLGFIKTNSILFNNQEISFDIYFKDEFKICTPHRTLDYIDHL